MQNYLVSLNGKGLFLATSIGNGYLKVSVNGVFYKSYFNEKDEAFILDGGNRFYINLVG